MELQRVLPSNALPEDAAGLLSTPTDLAETLTSEICQSYTRNNDAPAHGLPRVCWRCRQNGRPATDCECGVLRVSSGNVSSNAFQIRNTDVKAGLDQKYEFRPVSSLIDPPHHSAQAAIKADHPRRRQHLSWSSLSGPPWYLHVEFETPRYRQYRDRIREKGSKDGVWSDRVEEAFQLAIRRYPRRGRSKKELCGKLCGGNEFIANFIYQETGEVRNRKKVSSHLQVLKRFMVNNRRWMSLVKDIKTEKQNKKAGDSVTHEEPAGSCENSEDDDPSSYRPLQASYPPFPDRRSARFQIQPTDIPTLRRVSDFAMYLEDMNTVILHKYTKLQSETPSAPKALADVYQWRERYPALASEHDQGTVDCPMFLFDTCLSLMDCIVESQLAIRFSMVFTRAAHFTDWRSSLRFYGQNSCPVGLSESCDVLESEHVKGTDDARLPQVPFKSKWWVSVFSSMISCDKKAMTEEEEERATQMIQGLSVMQEIWATHRNSGRGPQRMAILLWRFSTAGRGVAATTSWRSLLPPLSAYDVQSPHPPIENPPLILDTALQSASPYATNHLSQPSIFSEFPSGELLAAPESESSSPSTTPAPESRSFPSSASITTYPLCPSQESFQSQDSAFSNLGYFDSQDSRYSLYGQDEVFEAPHESFSSHDFAKGSQEVYASQEVVYHSQDPLYQSIPDQLYEYPYQVVDAPVASLASQDFTGGQIQLSYAQTEDSPPSYEAPLLAPQANLVTQHQLIQHTEHFDQYYLDQNPETLNDSPHHVDEPGDAESLPQAYELNRLTIDYSTLEEALRLHPDLEHHLSINAGDEAEHMVQQVVSPLDQDTLESTQGEVVGEVQDGRDTLDRQLEC